jgi:hypothetical protein
MLEVLVRTQRLAPAQQAQPDARRTMVSSSSPPVMCGQDLCETYYNTRPKLSDQSIIFDHDQTHPTPHISFPCPRPMFISSTFFSIAITTPNLRNFSKA